MYVHPLGWDAAPAREAYDRQQSLVPGLLPEYFVARADTEDLLRQCFALRYQVYCIENQFEDPTVNVAGLESDIYDEQAVHALVIHVKTGIPVATIRLILPVAADNRTLPFFDVCDHLRFEDFCIAAGELGEMSRFAIGKAARRLSMPASNEQERVALDPLGRLRTDGRIAPTVGLASAVVRLCVENNVHYVCGLSSRGVLRRMGALGIKFDTIGPEVDHHGLRYPTMTNVAKLLDETARLQPDVWRLMSCDGTLRNVLHR